MDDLGIPYDLGNLHIYPQWQLFIIIWDGVFFWDGEYLNIWIVGL